MKIAFTHDFRGKLTGERFYLAGAAIDVDEETGAELIALGHAVAVEVEPAPEAEPEPVALEVEVEEEAEEAKPRGRGKRHD